MFESKPRLQRFIATTTTTYLVRKVSGSSSEQVLQKILKIIPTAALFGIEHIRVKVEAVITLKRLNL